MDVRRLLDIVGKPLTEEQLAAVTAPMEPTVLVAGAGTGKTTVMAARVLWLVGTEQVAPGEVLGLTFTNKAAAELGSRVRAGLRAAGLIGGLPAPEERGEQVEPDDEPSVLTYHAYAGRLLREHGMRIGVEPGARLLADATRFQLAARVLSRYDRPLHEVSHHLPTVIDQVLALDSELSEHLASTDDVRDHDRELIAQVDAWLAANAGVTKTASEPNRVMRVQAMRRLELLDLVDALRAERRRADTLDFSDQMRLAAELVRSAPPVVEQQRDAYRVVLLDEYQDTSVGQRVLLQTLFCGGHSVTAVGDPCQAIYGWRGASVRNIDQFPVDFPRADGSPAQRLSLTINNRSDEAVLDVANVLSEPLRAVHEGASPLVARADRRDAGRVITALHATHSDEIAWIADRIAALVHDDGTTPDDIAVLVRVSAEAAGLRDALLERDVPVDVVGLGGLLDIPEVADVIATLEVLDDPTANPSLVRLLSGPRWRIGIRDLRLLGRRAADLAGVRREVGAVDDDVTDDERLRIALAEAVAGVDPSEVVALVDAVEDPGHELPFSQEARDRFASLAAELRELRRHQAEPAADLIGRIVTRSGIAVEVAVMPHGDGGAALAQLADIAAQFSDVDGGTGVRSFLAFTRAARRFDRGLEPPTDATVGGVKLLTAHKAKGLEFPVVFVPTLSEKVFPSERGRPSWTRSAFTVPASLRGDSDDRPELGGLEKADHDALKAEDKAQAELEERRLAYVAVTRAEQLLVLTGHWWGPRQIKPRGPSSYLLTAIDHCATTPDARALLAVDAPAPADGEPNPQVVDGVEFEWPAPLEPAAFARRRAVAAAVRAARGKDGDFVRPSDDDERARVESWDRDIEALLEEARALHVPVRDVRVPAALSATTSLRLMRDPEGFAADLARPMPRPPAPAASRGTRFHDWVERHFRERQLAFTDLVDPLSAVRPSAPDLDDPEAAGEVPTSAADHDLMVGDFNEFGAVALDDLADLQAAFLSGPFADRIPHLVETPFGVSIGGLVVRGRIDAVYREPDGGYLVVDWKTGAREPDPWQLAVYRLAFAELNDVPIDRVRAVFYTVPTGHVDEPTDLPERAELEDLLRVST